MTMQRDDLEQVIREDLYGEAEAIQKEVDASEIKEMPNALKDDIRLKLQSRIDTYEKEQAYARLSEEDREALMLGRKIREERSGGRKKRRKRRIRMYAASAAAVLLVLGVGMTSTGGAERIASVIEQVVGGRKVVQVDSDEENKVSENEDEKEAYQGVKEAFGVEPVRLTNLKKGTEFIRMDLDDTLQTAEILYQYEDRNIWYIVSAGYYNSSFGFDVDDEIVDKEKINIKGNNIELMTYQVKETKEIKYLAHFTYQKLEYFLLGEMGKKDFKYILKNLYFL